MCKIYVFVQLESIVNDICVWHEVYVPASPWNGEVAIRGRGDDNWCLLLTHKCDPENDTVE